MSATTRAGRRSSSPTASIHADVLKRYPETAAFLRQAMRERGLPVPALLANPPSARGQVEAALSNDAAD